MVDTPDINELYRGRDNTGFSRFSKIKAIRCPRRSPTGFQTWHVRRVRAEIAERANAERLYPMRAPESGCSRCKGRASEFRPQLRAGRMNSVNGCACQPINRRPLRRPKCPGCPKSISHKPDEIYSQLVRMHGILDTHCKSTSSPIIPISNNLQEERSFRFDPLTLSMVMAVRQ